MSIWLNPRFLVYEPPLKERPSFRAQMRASWQLAPCCQVKYELWRLKEILTADGAFISHQLGHFTYICLSPQSNFLLRFPTLLLFLILGRCRSNNWSPNDLAIFCMQANASQRCQHKLYLHSTVRHYEVQSKAFVAIIMFAFGTHFMVTQLQSQFWGNGGSIWSQ